MSDVNSPEFWNRVYLNRATGWDLGGPTPVFCELAESGAFPPGRMLVLGAGRGYDARLFARHGFTVTAVDFAPEAVRDMHMLSEADAPVSIVQADLFNLPAVFEDHFDYVLEYVTYCAIDPSRRPEYVKSVSRVLRPGGRFIGLIFPISSHEGGPPFGVDPDELITLFEAENFFLEVRTVHPDTIKPRKGREELLTLQSRP